MLGSRLTMNRTDQAQEPSMEEILASIRLIISDDGRKEAAEDPESRLARPVMPSQPSPAQPLPDDDVLDLTDELVFAAEPSAIEEETAARSTAEAASPITSPKAPAVQPAPPPPEDAVPPAPQDRPPSQREAAKPSAGAARDAPQRTPAAATRPVWSRRELPASRTPPLPRSDRTKPVPPPAKSVQKSWSEDIKIPVPPEGPVPLNFLGEQREPSSQGLWKEGKEASEASAAQPEPARSPFGLDDTEEAKVAALAEKLARSAASAMDESELTLARQVDFEHLNEMHKAEVTETFANAIERERIAEQDSPLPTLLDEVLRQEFIRDAASRAKSAEEETLFKASDQPPNPEELPEIIMNEEPQELARGISQTRSRGVAASPAPDAAAEMGKTKKDDMADQALAQARYAGTAAHAQVERGLGLEETVREMLRPLLVQWLDRHMPRILEQAIREEIKTRGLFPKLPE